MKLKMVDSKYQDPLPLTEDDDEKVTSKEL